MPVKLTIEEDDEILENPVFEFEKKIPDDSMCISIKWNVPTEDPAAVEGMILIDYPFLEIARYLEHCNIKVLYSTFGYHLLGDAKIPHTHHSLVCSPLSDKDYNSITKNKSQHRIDRWFNKQTGLNDQFRFLTWKWTKKIDTSHLKADPLSYPLKEGHHFYETMPEKYIGISQDIFEYLLSVGQAIYNKEVGLHMRQDKCDERKKNALLELFSLVEKNKNKFNNFNSMLIWLDDNYISNLTIGEYPDPKNYKTNCQKIAIRLGFLKYSNLCV